MKMYVKPLALTEEELMEGVYAASGADDEDPYVSGSASISGDGLLVDVPAAIVNRLPLNDQDVHEGRVKFVVTLNLPVDGSLTVSGTVTVSEYYRTGVYAKYVGNIEGLSVVSAKFCVA